MYMYIYTYACRDIQHARLLRDHGAAAFGRAHEGLEVHRVHAALRPIIKYNIIDCNRV